MVSIFWVLLALFGIIGLLRGWAKEIIATMGIVLALFALYQFGPALFDENLVPNDYEQSALLSQPLEQRVVIVPDPNTLQVRAQQFALQAGFLVLVTFFAYQTPTALDFWTSRGGGGGRLHRLNEGLQQRILGLILGVINGWLVVGSIWYFAHQMGYPFGEYVVPPPPYATIEAHAQMHQWTLSIVLEQAGYQAGGLVGLSNALIASLPLAFIGSYLPVLVVVLFLILLIAVI